MTLVVLAQQNMFSIFLVIKIKLFVIKNFFNLKNFKFFILIKK